MMKAVDGRRVAMNCSQMSWHVRMRRTALAVIACMIVVLVSGRVWASDPNADNQACIDCHGDKRKVTKQFSFIDPEVISESVHAELLCTDCHADAKLTEADDTGVPHRKELSPVNCSRCHYRGNGEGAPNFSPMQEYKTSVHGRASLERGDRDVATCSACHGKHNVRPASDPQSTIYRANIPRTCAVCHDNMQMVLRHNIHAEQPYREYEQSVHGKALFKDGLVTLAAVCTDCHGVHDIQPNGSDDLKPHQPGTCGRCHLEEYNAYSRSIHGTAFKEGIMDAPSCSDCHGEHKIAAPWNPESSVSALHVANTCAGCHDDLTKMSKYNILTNKVSTYRKSDHGVSKDLGIVSVATCVSCHGYHVILPANDPRSSIHPTNLAKTCGEPLCHPGASTELLQSRIHVDSAAADFENLQRIRIVAIWSLGAAAAMAAVTGLGLLVSRVGQRFFGEVVSNRRAEGLKDTDKQ